MPVSLVAGGNVSIKWNNEEKGTYWNSDRGQYGRWGKCETERQDFIIESYALIVDGFHS